MYSSLRKCAQDLEKNGQLIRIKTEVDPYLEMAEIHRRIFDKQGPAILFEKVKGSPFQAISNIYGTFERTDFIFRKTLPKIKKVIALKADPTRLLKSPLGYASAPFTALKALPRKALFKTPVEYAETTIDKLPQVVSWPMDGGAFVTMPQVFTMAPGDNNMMQSNLGMYRIQLSGNDYKLNEEIGLHYQLHRGIGVHHQLYNQSDEPFKCSVFIGGLPSHAFSAIMPMPEGLSELTFGGMLGGKRFLYRKDSNGNILSGDADFVITGTIVKDLKKPEGPFGDHLGYYSLTHDFPVMKVDKVYHRKDPLWHFSVVGRPPMEDSSFGYLIHKLVGELASQEFPGLVDINAVDAAGVHPLLIAIGKERYMPFRERVPEEILTIANRILGSGQTSLAKFLIIASDDDDISDTHDIGAYFDHVLERIDWTRDLHFQTKTTIDTLDYSGSGWNAGSKVVMACRGEKKRDLSTKLDATIDLGSQVKSAAVLRKGILGISINEFKDYPSAKEEMAILSEELKNKISANNFPLIVVCDDPEFTAATLNNFLWVTFTRANPSHDLYGIEEFTEHKHWGCKGSLIIDARTKPHHAPGLVTDPEVDKRVDELFGTEESLREYG